MNSSPVQPHSTHQAPEAGRSRGPTGAQGAQGVAGATGATGAQGPQGIAGATVRAHANPHGPTPALAFRIEDAGVKLEDAPDDHDYPWRLTLPLKRFPQSFDPVDASNATVV